MNIGGGRRGVALGGGHDVFGGAQWQIRGCEVVHGPDGAGVDLVPKVVIMIQRTPNS